MRVRHRLLPGFLHLVVREWLWTARLAHHVETVAIAGRQVAQLFRHLTDLVKRALEFGLRTQCAHVVLHRGLKRLHNFGCVETMSWHIGSYKIRYRAGIVGAIRRPMNIEYVQQQTIANKKRLEEKDPATRAANFETLRKASRDPAAHRAFLMRTSLLESVRKQIAF